VGLAILFSLKAAPPITGGSASSKSLNEPRDSDEGAGLVGVGGAPADDDKDSDDDGGARANVVTLVDTLKLAWTSRQMQSLIFIILFNGASLGFNSGAFPLLYADTASAPLLLASNLVSFVASSFFFVNAAASALWGRVVGAWGRRRIFLASTAATGLWLSLVFAIAHGWIQPLHGSANAFALVFGVTAVFGFSDSVLESQVPAMLQSSSFFPRERDRDAANANLKMWQSLGFSLQFGAGAVLSATQQVYVLLPLFVLGFGGLWYCDAFIHKLDAASAETTRRTSTEDELLASGD
jgi:MFS family permease